MRIVHHDPPELGERDGLAYALFRPVDPPRARLVVLHGAGSVKESHYAWARSCRARGISAVCFDMRGHGESGGRLDGRVLDDVATMAAVAGEPVPGAAQAPAGRPAPLLLRGSSMGGWLALAAGVKLEAAGVVAICPAEGEALARALRGEELPEFELDVDAVVRVLASISEQRAAEQLGGRLLLMHAAGDETVPVEVSRELHTLAPEARYVEVPGGHHRSVQHDGELQAYALRWIDKVLSVG